MTLRKRNYPLTIICVMLAALIGVLDAGAERRFLITDGSRQLSSPASDQVEGAHIDYLADDNPETFWHSDLHGVYEGEHYFEISLDEPLNLAESDSLAVYAVRSENDNHHPTILFIEGMADGEGAGGRWEDVAHVFLTYRGSGTTEYSAKFHTSRPFTRLRVTVKANNSRTRSKFGYRMMNLAEFNIIRLGPGDTYSAKQTDRFRLVDDYINGYADYTVERTDGILDKRNRTATLDTWPVDKYSDGKWTADTEFWEANRSSHFDMPDFTPIDRDNDGTGMVKEGDRQNTHITEHVLYAIPGDAIALYPYYSLSTATQYLENFSHWYDYETGGGNEYLDFLIDPAKAIPVKPSDGRGREFIGGTGVPERYVSTDRVHYIRNVDDYREFARLVNEEGKTRLSGIVLNDLSFSGEKDLPMIGTAENPYRGYFSGSGYGEDSRQVAYIWGMEINRPDEDNVGMFGVVGPGAIISGIGFSSGCVFTGSGHVGIIGSVDYPSGATAEERKQMSADPVKIVDVLGDHLVRGRQNAGGILGCAPGNPENPIKIIIDNSAFLGTVTGPDGTDGSENAMLAAWMGSNPASLIINCYVTDNRSGEKPTGFQKDDDGKVHYIFRGSSRIVNTYYVSRNGFDYSDAADGIRADATDAALQQTLGSGWMYHSWDYLIPTSNKSLHDRRYYGTVATFFKPRDVTQGALQPLLDDGDDEYVIAADFSHSFDNAGVSIDDEGKKIVEPIINSRHVFRILDGKKFADDNMSTVEKNRAYVARNRRIVTARANAAALTAGGANFQLRFDCPVPSEGTTRSKWYYISNGEHDYRRICSQDIEIIDTSTGARTRWSNTDKYGQNASCKFRPAYDFGGEGTRSVDNVTYYACGGGGRYYRFLVGNLDESDAGKRYLVRLIAKDVNGDVITIPDSDEELWVQEFYIDVYQTENASLLSDAQLYGSDAYKSHRPEEMDAAYGDPKDRIDYDEFAALYTLPNNGSDYLLYKKDGWKDAWNDDKIANPQTHLFRWPLPFTSVNYSFGYDGRYDFNEYTVSNHSAATIYNGNNNEPYDRLYYYDRRFNPDRTPRQGFFFYVNAAADPGDMATLRLDNFCTGSTIHVSAWMIESSGSERANVAFNFFAVKKDTRERVPIHTFVSGYVPTIGDWYHACYSFVPETSVIATDIAQGNISHYELVLESNCTNSGGADYAIDDIRVYVTSPVVYARQTRPVCDTGDGPEVPVLQAPVKVFLHFDTLLQSIGMSSDDTGSGENMELYYTFVDKEIYDAGKDQEAFEEGVLRFGYRGSDEIKSFGKLMFNTNWSNHADYETGGGLTDFDGEMAYRELAGSERFISFNAMPSGDKMQPGKEFYVVLWAPSAEKAVPDGGPGFEQFNIADDCSKKTTFRVLSSTQIKINGELVPDNDDYTVCENQQPVVQIDLFGKYIGSGSDGEIAVVEKNAAFDWYTGPYSDFVKEGTEAFSLREALMRMRIEHPFETDIDRITAPKGDFSEEMYEFVRSLVRPESGEPGLLLGGNTYVFPPVTGATEYVYVTAVPMNISQSDFLICTNPTEVRMRVYNHAPLLLHGFDDSEMHYPADLTDVPLRVGLRQLRAVSAPGASTDASLVLPIRRVQAVTDGVTAMRMSVPEVTLVGSDDPDYKNIQGGDRESGDFITAGMLRSITAVGSGTALTNELRLSFDSDAIELKEGYTYRFRYHFAEDMSGVPGDIASACPGQDVFTIKVVPEYQVWTGSEGDDWNNDANWRRAVADEILDDGTDDKTDYLADKGTNTATRSFVPLDFTKTVIQAPAGDTGNVPGLHAEGETTVNVIQNVSSPWSALPCGDATYRIHYDMASTPAGPDIRCRPWLANECEQIHFDNGAWIGAQQHLRYEKAWADVEFDSDRWYLLSSPFKGTVAGDMYMPSADARQTTEKFRDITFDKEGGVNDRFAPAVFQRSWDRGTARVFELPSAPGAEGTVSNVAVTSTWSHVFNDVEEKYSPGSGFSIKADVTKVGDSGDKVLMRLPKADESFTYWSQDGDYSGNTTVIDRSDNYRLNDAGGEMTVTARTAAPGKYFLVGNPYMTFIDMKEFLRANAGVIQPKYWIMTGNAQGAAVFDEDKGEFVGTMDDAGLLAPMQGFFVEANAEAAAVNLKFTPGMMYGGTSMAAGNRPGIRSRSGEAPALTVTAESADGAVTRAIVIENGSASAGYDASEDAPVILDRTFASAAQVYTIAGNMAAAVNVTPSPAGTEIGLTEGAAGGDVTLRFEGAGEFGDLMLYDAATDDYIDLDDDTEYTVSGAASGRLFIVKSKMAADKVAGIDIRVDGRDVTVVSQTAGASLTVRVADTTGRVLRNLVNCGQTAVFTAAPGMMIVDAYDGYTRVTRKLIVK